MLPDKYQPFWWGHSVLSLSNFSNIYMIYAQEIFTITITGFTGSLFHVHTAKTYEVYEMDTKDHIALKLVTKYKLCWRICIP